MAEKIAKLNMNGKEYDLPILESTLGPDVVKVSELAKDATFTFDPGYNSTASCESKITFIDGSNGILLHRGYPIEQLAEKCEFLEVAHLLLHGELPNKNQKNSFYNDITHHTLVHEQIPRFFSGFRRDAHPMAIMVGVVGALSAFYHTDLDFSSQKNLMLAALRLIAKMPTLAAMTYKYSLGQPFIYPINNLDYAENFLHMMFSLPTEETNVNPVLAKALDKIMILHADHEQNASTSTVRMAGSTGANPFACIAAGIGALWGPAHGGANEACLNMLETIGDEGQIDKYIKKAKDKDDPFRLMGFGHRVYKNYDPRAKIMQKTCHDVLETVGAKDDPLFKLAMKLEKIALEDEYFVDRKLYPNVDFYSGITLRALGVPRNMFTVFFAVARTAGWISQWLEMHNEPTLKLARPRQRYLGATERDVPPIDKR